MSFEAHLKSFRKVQHCQHETGTRDQLILKTLGISRFPSPPNTSKEEGVSRPRSSLLKPVFFFSFLLSKPLFGQEKFFSHFHIGVS